MRMTFSGHSLRKIGTALAVAAVSVIAPVTAFAGAQSEEHLASSVVTLMSRAIADQPIPVRNIATDARAWLDEMSRRLDRRIADPREREDFLATVHYEATRAGLDPQLVMGVIETESAFRKYAISTAGARGYMQVMPFWPKVVGSGEHNLFHLRTNLRYGCVILRHYLDIENGDVFRALGRYNGSLGRDEYPNAVLGAMTRNWLFTPDARMIKASATAAPSTPTTTAVKAMY